ncbi:MAG: phage tail assembly chaperone [Pseudooceanicola sp.]|nr:phage tail assembly chaperone [Pseudooceanicola sp.]
MRLDWPGMMRAGIRGLGLAPDAFWRLTPAELLLKLGPLGEAPMNRGRLEALLAAYPDAKESTDG